jgi:hypothetical protein
VPLNLKLENDTRSYSLFGRGVSDTKYCIDGIDLSFMNDNMSDEQLEQEFETAEQDFVKRINKFINNRSFKKIA